MGQNLSYPDPRILSAVKSQIDSTKILVVSKTRCKACIEAKQLLNQLAANAGINPTIFDIDSYGLLCKNAIIKHLSAQTGVKTVPQIWINGSFVGGNDTIQKLHREGRLLPMIRKTKVSQTLQDSIGTSTLRIAPFKAEVIPFRFLDNFPIQINTMNQYKSNNLSTGNGSLSFSSSINSTTSAMSFQDNTSDLISSVPTTYSNDDYKQQMESTIIPQSSANFFDVSSLKSSTPQNITTSRAEELKMNWVPSSKKTISSNVPSFGSENNHRLLTDEEILAVSWV